MPSSDYTSPLVGDPWVTEKLREYQHVLECVDPVARARVEALLELSLQTLEAGIAAASAERSPAHA